MYSISDLATRLGSVRHFSHLSYIELEQIVLLGQVQSYQTGEILFHEDDPGAGLFVLFTGQVQLCKLSPQGQNAILAIFDPVIMFNEVAALDCGPNPATALALGEVTVWRLAAEHLEALILRHPQVGMGLLRVMAGRNRYLVGQFEDLSFRSVLARAAKLLVELSEQGTRIIDRHKHPNHQLASRIATVPEAFSRSLKVFKTNGDIVCTGSTIKVVRPEQLKIIARFDPKPA